MIGQSDSLLDSLPEGWQFDRMKDVVALRNEKAFTSSEEDDYLELEDIDSGTGKLLSKQNTLDVESAVTLFKRGDVLFGKLRPYLEKYYLAEFDGKCTGEILAFNPERINGLFLRYCIASPWFIEKCNALAYGAKMPRVNWPTQLAVFDIPIPPEKEQRRIAVYLDKTCVAIDTAIEKKQKQLETLDALRKTIIHKAVTRGLDDSVELKDSGVAFFGLSPRSWRRTKLRYEISIRNGDFVSDKLDAEGEYPVIGGNGLMGRTPAYNINGDVVVIGRVGAYCGIAHYISEKAWISDNALIVESAHNKRFLTHLFNTLDFNTEANRTAQPVITGTKIKNIYVMLPPIQEQGNISNYIDTKNAELTELQRNLNDQVATLQQYRKSLIHECVTGKRRVE